MLQIMVAAMMIVAQIRGLRIDESRSWPMGYLARKAVMAGWATMKVSITSVSTMAVSESRSATIEPNTVVKGAFCFWATYVHRHTSPRRGNTRLRA